jgi:hypothetical protein
MSAQDGYTALGDLHYFEASVCHQCGSVVVDVYKPEHDEWHRRVTEMDDLIDFRSDDPVSVEETPHP